MERMLNKGDDTLKKKFDYYETHQKYDPKWNSQPMVNNKPKSSNNVKTPYNKYFEFYQNTPLGFFILNKNGTLNECKYQNVQPC